MGSSASIQTANAQVAVSPSKATKLKAGKKFINEKSSRKRNELSKTIQSVDVVNNSFSYNMEYCYASQRGYYPNDLTKANQDSFVICESIQDDNYCHLFGVFDGHGEFGDLCSYYSADKVPEYLVKETNLLGGLSNITDKEFQQAYSNAFIKTDTALRSSKIDDSLSGTTGITVFVKGDKLFVANVGDSRAIIASKKDGKLVYSPLSNDQTPYRKDERERLKALVFTSQS
jgi:serine/threonine protein phosphatase PrpC